VAKLLLLEDDPAIARTVVYALERDGFTVLHCLLLSDARRALQTRAFDLLMLDVGLPDGSGLDLCREVRARHPTPILLLSARNEEIDRVLGLELGADDYVSKPFSPRELVARVKALLRRSAMAPAPANSAPGGFEVDLAGQRILLHGLPLTLTRREFRLLGALLRGPGRIHSREQLLEAAWGDDSDSTDRTVDTHIKTLRAKLRQADPARECIVTHRGMGYSIELPPA
jgi:two-component system catabolic regulation response regulator CreB